MWHLVKLFGEINEYEVQLGSFRAYFAGNIIDCCDKSKKDGKDQETIQSSTTPDPGYHKGK